MTEEKSTDYFSTMFVSSSIVLGNSLHCSDAIALKKV